jgi:hypothetical protein
MKKILFIILFSCGICLADDDLCKSLYDDFMKTLEPQMTELCVTTMDGVFSYKFYLKDNDGYHNFDLVFSSMFSYLFVEGDNNPFECDSTKISHTTQKPEEIVKTIFLPKADCSDEFKKSIGVEI